MDSTNDSDKKIENDDKNIENDDKKIENDDKKIENDDKKIFPKMSIIVPVLNSETDIDRCVKSLINQDYPKDRYEIIIVDNGSIDNTLDILHIYDKDIKILCEQRKGSYNARNTGIKNSQGELIAFTDSDCIAHRNWLRELFMGFTSENIGCVVGSVSSYPGKTLVEIYSSNREILSQETTLNFKFLPYGQTANVAFRRKIFDTIGNFDEELKSGGDADIAWRMQLSTNYKLAYRPESMVQHHHRTTLKNLFVQHFKYGLGSASLYKKYSKDMQYGAGQSLSEWLKLAFNECYKSIQKLIKNRSIYYIIEPLLTIICTAGYRTGRIYGSFKLKLFYV